MVVLPSVSPTVCFTISLTTHCIRLESGKIVCMGMGLAEEEFISEQEMMIVIPETSVPPKDCYELFTLWYINSHDPQSSFICVSSSASKCLSQ